jgi:hypothetical protein
MPAMLGSALGSLLGTCFMTNGRPAQVKSVTVTFDGVTHHGTYFVLGSMVHVRSPLGAKSTRLGGSSPGELAMLLLSELVREAKPQVS